MRLQITNKKLSEIKADLELIFVVDKDLKHKFIKDEKAFKFANYKGENVLLLTEQARLYVPLNKLNFEEFRLSAAKAYNALKTLNVKTKFVSERLRLRKNELSGICGRLFAGSLRI